MKKFLFLRVSVGLLSLAPFPVAAQTLYQDPSQAQAQCPNDTVVWLNTRTGVYHFQGERWYANTEEGAFVCERDADNSGDRPTRNGE